MSKPSLCAWGLCLGLALTLPQLPSWRRRPCALNTSNSRSLSKGCGPWCWGHFPSAQLPGLCTSWGDTVLGALSDNRTSDPQAAPCSLRGEGPGSQKGSHMGLSPWQRCPSYPRDGGCRPGPIPRHCGCDGLRVLAALPGPVPACAAEGVWWPPARGSARLPHRLPCGCAHATAAPRDARPDSHRRHPQWALGVLVPMPVLFTRGIPNAFPRNRSPRAKGQLLAREDRQGLGHRPSPPLPAPQSPWTSRGQCSVNTGLRTGGEGMGPAGVRRHENA